MVSYFFRTDLFTRTYVKRIHLSSYDDVIRVGRSRSFSQPYLASMAEIQKGNPEIPCGNATRMNAELLFMKRRKP
jgi:hypothetical protein